MHESNDACHVCNHSLLCASLFSSLHSLLIARQESPHVRSTHINYRSLLQKSPMCEVSFAKEPYVSHEVSCEEPRVRSTHENEVSCEEHTKS